MQLLPPALYSFCQFHSIDTGSFLADFKFPSLTTHPFKSLGFLLIACNITVLETTIFCFCISFLIYIALHFIIVLNAASCLLAGAIVGIVIRYGLDAEKHLYVLDCWPDPSKSNSTKLPSSVVVVVNGSNYEYTGGKDVGDKYTAHPQFEDKVLILLSWYCYYIITTATQFY